jgi:hypothetical protein
VPRSRVCSKPMMLEQFIGASLPTHRVLPGRVDFGHGFAILTSWGDFHKTIRSTEILSLASH